MRRSWLLFAVLLIVWSTAAWAQLESIDIVPFGGYRWSGGMSSIPGVRNFDVKDAATYGVALDMNMPRNSAAELYYAHWSGDWNASLTSGGDFAGKFSRDDIMLNGLWYASRSAAIRPYISAGLGVAIYDTDNASASGRFAWSLGAGARKDINDKVGLRADFRWMPTWFTTGSSAWCDPWYGCYPVSTGEFFDQWEVTGGLIVKLGTR
jgi:hypothetical protein